MKKLKYVLFFLAMIILITGIALILSIHSGLANSSPGNSITKEESMLLKQTYEKLWNKLDGFTDKGLPKSALEVVEIIYEKSKKENNLGQFIKAIVYKMRLIQETDDEAFVKVQKFLIDEQKNSHFPVTSILHSMMAEQYWNFYNSNRYRFFNRTDTSTQFKNDDMETWSLKQIVETVLLHYKQSLDEPEALKKIAVNIIDPVLNINKEGRKMRPTLYDFLTQRAVDFYMNEEAGLTTPKYEFVINSPEYFSNAQTFTKLQLTTKDSLSFEFHALSNLQDLIRFHLGDATPDALLDVDLKRLRYVYNKSVMENKESAYEDALKEIIKRFEGSPLCADAMFELASLYNSLGEKYNPGDSDTFKWHRKKAHEICQEVITKYPGSIGAYNCKALLNIIEARILNLKIDKISIANKPSPALLNYRNVDTVYYKIIKLETQDLNTVHQLDQQHIVEFMLKKQVVLQWQNTLPNDNDYQTHAVEIKIDPLNFGSYALLASDNQEFNSKKYAIAFNFFTISNITYINRTDFKKGLEFYLLDRNTGHPLPDASFQVIYKRYNSNSRTYEAQMGKMFKSDSNGYLNIPYGSIIDNYFYVEISNNQDRLYLDDAFNLYTPYIPPEKKIRTVFFTDRSIYRPGQTIYFKGIVMELDTHKGDACKILPQYQSTVKLFDVNHQEVAHLNLITNEYGTFDGTFTLPTQLLNGEMQITDSNGNAYFSVEEYKRPKFEVIFNPIEKSYRLNDHIEVKGQTKAFAGYSIDNAQVEYRVTRDVYFPYSWYAYHYRYYYNSGSPKEIDSGFTTTDASGAFTIPFQANPDLSIPKESMAAFCFTITADVTDINGETHSTEKRIYVGYTSLKLGFDIPDRIDKNLREIKGILSSSNLSGDFIPARGTISISKLKSPDKPFRNRKWDKPDKFLMTKNEFYSHFPFDVYDNEDNINSLEIEKAFFQGSFDTSETKEVKLNHIDQWDPGQYRVELFSQDEYGNNIKEIKYFTLYSSTSKNLPFTQTAWLTSLYPIVEPGNNAVFLIGSSETNVKILYEIEFQGKITQSQFITMNNEQKLILIPINEEHRGNIGVHFTFIKHNRLYTNHYTVYVPWTNKNLDISFATFRNKLNPGEKEQWQIKIKGPHGAGVAAEMVATLYDASLDAFRGHAWNFNVFPSNYLSLNWFSNSFQISNSQNCGVFQAPTGFSHRDYDRLNWFYFYPTLRSSYGAPGGIGRMSRSKGEGAIPPPSPMAMAEAAPDVTVNGKIQSVDSLKAAKAYDKSSFNVDGTVSEADNQPSQKSKSEEAPLQIRSNFNETAFFYPRLYTTPDGDVTITFTIPEALTKWKMLGFAHTKNLEYGFTSRELITQKDLMVVPNPPRFFREGDTIVFTSKIINLTQNEISGTARLNLFDATTMKPIDSLFANASPQQPFKSSQGQSALVSWRLQIPDGQDIDAVTYRLTAVSGQFSDGEELAIPLLKNRMMVTETFPLPLKALQEKTFSFDKLIHSNQSPTLKNHQLTLEFTSNPVWYVVQTLPYMMEYPYECMEQVFSRYYANSIASYIVNSNPKIKTVFDIWKRNLGNTGSPDANALLSNLEKNQELKTVLLEETPWVLNGQNETQRKQRISLLFDLNNMSQQFKNALKKLQEGQALSGGWPWFKGMQENRYITQHIVAGFGHLHTLNVIDPSSDNRIIDMMRKAVIYIDAQLKNEYDLLIKRKVNLKENNLSYAAIHYFYARSFFKDFPLDDRDVKAFNYYKTQMKNYWPRFKDNKYLQGMIALSMNRYNEKQVAINIAQSIKEYALHSEELGMYWKGSSGYYWYQAPIETQALLIEMFQEVMNDKTSVDEMKTWLLKQKQTQDWHTTKATADACYALLLRGDDWLMENNQPQITIGTTNPSNVEPGLNQPNDESIKAQTGTGYFKVSWNSQQITPDMGTITVKNNNKVPAWGGLYWQYFENLDKITPAETPLKLKKQLFIEHNTDTGPVIDPINQDTPLKPGDRIKVRIELRVDRAMEYVHMKDMRASAFEPQDVLSSYKWQDGLGYYQSTKDASTNFFFDYLPKGTYVFEYSLHVTHQGNFSNGITSIQSMYAPEFTSHSEGVRVSIEEKK